MIRVAVLKHGSQRQPVTPRTQLREPNRLLVLTVSQKVPKMLILYDEKESFPHVLTAEIASTKVETVLLPVNLCFNPSQRDTVKTYF